MGVEVSLEAFLMMLFRNWHLQEISHLVIVEEVASVKSTQIFHDQKFIGTVFVWPLSMIKTLVYKEE